MDRLVNQYLATTGALHNLSAIEHLIFLLPDRVGSPLSVSNLREDLEVNYATVKHWLELLERVFYGFPVRTFTLKSSRMLKKEYKWYLWDWTEIKEAGPRFENAVAVHLLKYINYINDCGIDKLSMHYIRDSEKREVDFVICRNREPYILIECRKGVKEISKHLIYYSGKLKIRRALQLVHQSIEPYSYIEKGIKVEVASAASFLKLLA